MHREGSGARPRSRRSLRTTPPRRSPCPVESFRTIRALPIRAPHGKIYVATASIMATAIVDPTSLKEQVDKDFAVAGRRAWMHGVGKMLSGKARDGGLLPFEETRRLVGASAGVGRGRSTGAVAHIVGSDGKSGCFDGGFMPLRGVSRERWERGSTGRSGSGKSYPPVSLHKLGEGYFVQDGHHRVSVARFHGVEEINAEVTKGLGTRRAGRGEAFKLGGGAGPTLGGRRRRGPSRRGGRRRGPRGSPRGRRPPRSPRPRRSL